MSSLGTSIGNKTIGAVHGNDGGVQRIASVGYVGTPIGNKVWFSALSASATPTFVSGLAAPPVVVTSASTASPTGGVGPFTYLWTFVSGGAVTVVGPTSASTVFQGAAMGAGETRTAFFHCTITDTATGLSAVSNLVEAEVRRI